MTPAQKKRLFLATGITFTAAAAIGLLCYAMSESIDHYYSLSQIAARQAPVEQDGIRVGGIVEKGSVRRRKDSLEILFRIGDSKHHSLPVRYDGILPDLFREGQGVIARGRLARDGLFQASEILAKHDATYMPQEVRADLAKNGGEPNSGAGKAR